VIELIQGKHLRYFSEAEIALITGYIGSADPWQKSATLELLSRKIVTERLHSNDAQDISESHNKIFAELPELAVKCAEDVLLGEAVTVPYVNIFLKPYPAVLVNITEQLTKLVISENKSGNNSRVLEKLKEIIINAPLLQSELKLNLLDLDPQTTEWAKSLLEFIETQKPESEYKKTLKLEIVAPSSEGKKADSEEPDVRMHIGELNLSDPSTALLPAPSNTYLPTANIAQPGAVGRVKALAAQFQAVENTPKIIPEKRKRTPAKQPN
jgi:hypothetical protein